MTKIIFDISMTLDGYINAENPRLEAGLGDDGERLHDWAFNSQDQYNKDLLARIIPTLGASIAGRTTYDLSIQYWGPNGPTGDARVPTVVITHSPPSEVPDGHVYTFVEDIKAAVEEAKKLAGKKDVTVMGGADIARQFLEAGLLDEISIHLVPLLFGKGTRLFDEFPGAHIQLEAIEAVKTKEAVHLRYRVIK